MIGLEHFYSMSVEYLREHGTYLEVHPLPVVVYLFQKDLINQYELLLHHHHCHILEKFVSDEVPSFNICIKEMIRHTSRLFHSTKNLYFLEKELFEERGTESNYFVDIAFASPPVGLEINVKHKKLAICSPNAPAYRSAQFRHSSYSLYDERDAERLAEDMSNEIEQLKARSQEFENQCHEYYRSHPIIAPFSMHNESWWMY